jgi:hypothetical protein
MVAFVSFLLAAVGLASGALNLWDAYVKRRDKLFPPEPPTLLDPATAIGGKHEERVLLRFDESKRDEPGTLEHFVYSLRAPLKPGYQETFITAPSATLWQAKNAIGFCYIAVGYAAFALLLLLLVPIFSGTVQGGAIRYALSLLVAASLCAVGGRPLWRISQNAQAAIRAANAYREYIAAEKIQIGREFTQARSRFEERQRSQEPATTE